MHVQMRVAGAAAEADTEHARAYAEYEAELAEVCVGPGTHKIVPCAGYTLT